MSILTFTEKEKRALVNLIQAQVDTHLSRFPFARYPFYPIDEWKRIMCDPASVNLTQLKEMLSWVLGGWQRQDMSLKNGHTVRSIIKSWPDFVSKLPPDAAGWLGYWEGKITDWTSGFNAIAFLLHLHRSDDYEIADHHRIQAMNELLKEINHQEKGHSFIRSIRDLECYTDFFRALLPKLPFGDLNRVQLDRFLKAYGNRHAYKNVSSNYKTKEPELWQFSWSDTSVNNFYLDEIILRSNADILFACLLVILERNQISHENLTVGQVIDLLPIGTAGICNPASYSYALIALFGNQKGRDYFLFDDRSLQNSFTQQANNSTRDMRFHIRVSKAAITLNKKYIRV